MADGGTIAYAVGVAAKKSKATHRNDSRGQIAELSEEEWAAKFEPLKALDTVVSEAIAWASYKSSDASHDVAIWRSAGPVLEAIVEAIRRKDLKFFENKVSAKLSTHAERYVVDAKHRKRAALPPALLPLDPFVFSAALGDPTEAKLGQVLVQEAKIQWTYAHDAAMHRKELATHSGRAAFIARGMAALIVVSDGFASFRAKTNFSQFQTETSWNNAVAKLSTRLEPMLTKHRKGGVRAYEDVARETLRAFGVGDPKNYLRG